MENDKAIYFFYRVISPTEFEVVLYLNQMGEFNFIGKPSFVFTFAKFFKGTLARDFRPSDFFSSTNPDLRPKAVSHMAACSPRYSIKIEFLRGHCPEKIEPLS
jgi:hypothetical protein